MANYGVSLEQVLGTENYARFKAVLEANRHLNHMEVTRLLASQGIIVSRTVVQRQRKKLDAPLTPASTTLPPLTLSPTLPAAAAIGPEPTPQLGVLLRENSRLRRKLAERDSGWDVIKQVIEEVYEAPSNIIVVPPKASAVPGSPETAVFHVTDVHYGKETPTYNIQKTEERMLKYFQSCTEIVGLRRQTASIDRARLLLGGDMIEGEGIFPHQAWETEVDLIDQMIKGGPEVIVTLILSLLGVFPTLDIDAVPGNHGRQGKFNSPRLNADSIFYEIVRKLVQLADPAAAARVNWNLPLDRLPGQQWYARFEVVPGHGGMLVHADQVRGQLGFPWYGYGKKVGGWRTAPETGGFKHLWGGHFHTYATFDMNDATIYSTGSVESSNSYALENMAAAGLPKQRLSFFNQRYGLLSDYPIVLS